MKNKIDEKLVLIFILLAIILIVGIFATINQHRMSDKIVIPKELTGFIYNMEDNQVILKLDLENPKHSYLLNTIDQFCEKKDIPECQDPFR